jgi:hypothetical protein
MSCGLVPMKIGELSVSSLKDTLIASLVHPLVKLSLRFGELESDDCLSNNRVAAKPYETNFDDSRRHY